MEGKCGQEEESEYVLETEERKGMKWGTKMGMKEREKSEESGGGDEKKGMEGIQVCV